MVSSRASRILIFFIVFGGLLLLISCPLRGGSKNFILYVAEFEVGPFRGTNAYKVYKSLSPSDYDKIPFSTNSYQFQRNMQEFFRKKGAKSVKMNFFLKIPLVLNGPEFKRGFGSPDYFLEVKASLKSTNFSNTYNLNFVMTKKDLKRNTMPLTYSRGGFIPVNKNFLAWSTAFSKGSTFKITLMRLEKER